MTNMTLYVCDTLLMVPQILFAYEDEKGEDVVEAMDFWKSQQRKSVMPDGSAEKMGQLVSPTGSNHSHSRLAN